MKTPFECAASTVIEGRAAAWKDDRGVHIRAYGVSWTLSSEDVRKLVRDIRRVLRDDELPDPWTLDAYYSVDSDDEYGVSIRYEVEDTLLVIDNMDAEMLADWLEGCE